MGALAIRAPGHGGRRSGGQCQLRLAAPPGILAQLRAHHRCQRCRCGQTNPTGDVRHIRRNEPRRSAMLPGWRAPLNRAPGQRQQASPSALGMGSDGGGCQQVCSVRATDPTHPRAHGRRACGSQADIIFNWKSGLVLPTAWRDRPPSRTQRQARRERPQHAIDCARGQVAAGMVATAPSRCTWMQQFGSECGVPLLRKPP